MGVKREKAVVVLRHLLRGGRAFKVRFQGEETPRTLVMSEDYELCELRKRENGEDVLLPVLGIDIGPFVKLCEKLTDDEVFSIGAATALDDMASGRPRRQVGVATDGDEA
jgi:hypothetical protein